MKAMNVNTVYTYLDPGLDAGGAAVLDQLYANGIMIVMTVDEDGNYDLARLQQVVDFYKDHPAVLAWMVGSEWNVNPAKLGAASVADAAAKVEQAARLVKSLDANHPVATSYADIDIDDAGKRLADTRNYVNNVCPSVDLWGLNVYRSNTFTTLFEQWKAVSGKPMFLGEFGTDAFRSTSSAAHPPDGGVDGLMQSQWESSEWAHLFRNLSANDATKAALGGFVFEWNDEWWKVPETAADPGAHNRDGCDFNTCGGHPDHFGNEEYFGIVDIGRQPRLAYDALKAAFDPAYQPPASVAYRAVSRGASAPEEYSFQSGSAILFRDGEIVYRADGGAHGGRGFNLAVYDACTNSLSPPGVRHYDTFETRTSGSKLAELTSDLSSVPDGSLVLMSVADEAGLNCFPGGESGCGADPGGCAHLGASAVEAFFQQLEALGSEKIRDYCFRNSWAFVAVKGEGVARGETLGAALEVSAQGALSVSLNISPTGRSFLKDGGAGGVSVSAPGGCVWGASTAAGWITPGVGGSGSGTLNYSVAANAGADFRTGVINVGGRPFGVVQSPFASDLRIDAVTPPAGRASGGQQIRLGGAFVGLSSVKVGGVNASWVYSNGAGDTSAINVSAPAHAAGAVSIELTPASGTGYTKADAFAYLPTVFTDDTLVAHVTTVRAQHVIELRQAVDALRAVAGLAPASWTDPSLLPAATNVKAAHVTELRARLEDAASRLGYAPAQYTDPALAAGALIKRVHIEELRQRIRDIAG
jgi:hypothetical protein